MPYYLEKTVSDEYLNGLKQGYRDGYKNAGHGAEADESDQVILDRLAEEKVITVPGAIALGTADGAKAAAN